MSLNHDGTTSAATRLGFEAGQIIQEYYFDDDADMALRAQLEEAQILSTALSLGGVRKTGA